MAKIYQIAFLGVNYSTTMCRVVYSNRNPDPNQYYYRLVLGLTLTPYPNKTSCLGLEKTIMVWVKISTFLHQLSVHVI